MEKTFMKVAKISSHDVEQEYLEGIRLGRRQTLDQIYRQLFPQIKHFIIKHSGTEEDAKDVFQDALLAVYHNVQDQSFTLSCKFSTYVFAICRNLWLKKLRSNKVSFVTINENILTIDGEELEEVIRRNERIKIYHRQFRAISEKCQQLLELYMQGVNMKSIAEQLGFASVSYARKRKFKCKEQLMDRIKKDEVFQNLVDNE